MDIQDAPTGRTYKSDTRAKRILAIDYSALSKKLNQETVIRYISELIGKKSPTVVVIFGGASEQIIKTTKDKVCVSGGGCIKNSESGISIFTPLPITSSAIEKWKGEDVTVPYVTATIDFRETINSDPVPIRFTFASYESGSKNYLSRDKLHSLVLSKSDVVVCKTNTPKWQTLGVGNNHVDLIRELSVSSTKSDTPDGIRVYVLETIYLVGDVTIENSETELFVELGNG